MNTEKKIIYPIEAWNVTETAFEIEHNYRNETTFALSNGYLGTRGTFEEGYPFTVEEGLEGNFINGFYESEEIRYGEWNFGFPVRSQSLLNVCNAKELKVWLDDELFDMRYGKISEYSRTLDMKNGIVSRNLEWTSPEGKRMRLHTERLVSFAEQHAMAIRMKIMPLEGISKIRVESILDADVQNHTRTTNPLVDYGPFGRHLLPDRIVSEESGAYYEGTVQNSMLSMACMTWQDWSMEPVRSYQTKEFSASEVMEWEAETGKELLLDKLILYTTSLDTKADNMEFFLRSIRQRIHLQGYEGLRSKQSDYMKRFWNRSDVVIQGNDALQQGIRFNLFHIMQSAGRDGIRGMGAKGLSGEGYEGHYFWDTEMYVLPFFTYTSPELAKGLLDYRYHTLDQARKRARVLGHEKGALYPWRTINGEEASTYFPLGTAQYHINGDIAYAFWQYLTVTKDWEYLKEAGAEVLCETARVYADVGSFAECRDGKYCICAVTGPDEYNAIVDNNFYTNLMARETLRYALKSLEMLKEYDEAACIELMERLQITEKEQAQWQRIIDNMYFPYDEKRRIYPLDDGFLMRKPWDESKIPPEKRHLLYENYHPLFIYRQRMSKQADAILGMYLHSNFFTKEELERNYDFYQEVTLHHSSLSTCIFGIVACEIGRYEDACRYFYQSARMDLDDYHENFYAGIHAANMAGTWQAMINGFAGLRTNKGTLSFSPYLPDGLEGYRFHIQYGKALLSVEINSSQVEFTLEEGENIRFSVYGKEAVIEEAGGHYIEKI